MSLSLPNDFAADVLDILKRRKVRFHGCPPWYLERKRDGDVKMWFYGHRKGVAWAGGVTILKRPDIDSAVATGDSQIFASICEQIIDEGQMRFK